MADKFGDEQSIFGEVSKILGMPNNFCGRPKCFRGAKTKIRVVKKINPGGLKMFPSTEYIFGDK
jgi:hypothetical protein